MAAITGFGAVSALGRGVGCLWSAMAEGRDGIVPIARFAAVQTGIAGMVPDRNAPEHSASASKICVDIGIAAAREAWQHAALDGIARDRIALVFGSSIAERGIPTHEVAAAIADALGIAGPRITISTACTSATNAIGLALDLLRLDAADAVIAGGSDVLSPIVVAGFSALGVLSPGKCAPFSEPPGTTLGEGAGFVVLERHARGGAKFAVHGYGLSADGFHDTGPDPSGAGIARSIRGALVHAGVAPDEVGYINAHGTGTLQNDPAEWRAIQLVFGDRAAAIPVSSSKSFLGHAQGAAGALELISTLVALEHGTIPPTMQFTTARPNSPPDVVGQPTARAASCDLAVSTNSAFGGANCAIVVGRSEREPSIVRRPLSISGCGIVGPHGMSLEQIGVRKGRVPRFKLEDVAPTADPRGLDPTTRYLIAAVVRALDEAGIKLRGEARERTGIVLGVVVASPESEAACYRKIDEHGYRGMSANLFSRLVLNAPAGTCAKLLGVRGPHSTLSAGASTGLAAIIYAAEMLATRRHCDHLLAVGVDELAEDRTDSSEGAACVVLSAATGLIGVTGWSVAGPGRLADAARRALAMAGLERADVTIGEEHAARVGASPAYTPASAVIAAVHRVRTRDARHVLVTQAGEGSADCAIVIAHAT